VPRIALVAATLLRFSAMIEAQPATGSIVDPICDLASQPATSSLPPLTARHPMDLELARGSGPDHIKLELSIPLDLCPGRGAITLTAEAPPMEGGASALGHVIENQRVGEPSAGRRNTSRFEIHGVPSCA
jgi:hypothetical protein